MASPATSPGPDGSQHYSSLATPTRSSFRRQGGRTGTSTASVRFHEDVDHAEGLGSLKGRNPIEVKQAIFKKYFNEFAAYPLIPASPSRSTRGATSRHVRSAPGTPVSRAGRSSILEAPWTVASTVWTQPSEWALPKPRPTATRQLVFQTLKPDDPTSLLHAATRPITKGGNLSSHQQALDGLLSKAWTRKEVEQAQAFGFFRRLVPLLGVPQLQCAAALLLARCARLAPALLLPLAQPLCAALPVLVACPRGDVRQAGLCLLGLLWRAAAASHPQVRGQILAAPRLLEALSGEATVHGDTDALWALREIAADERGVSALERSGALRALCTALRRLAAEGSDKDDGGGDEGDGKQDGGMEGPRTKGNAAGVHGAGRQTQLARGAPGTRVAQSPHASPGGGAWASPRAVSGPGAVAGRAEAAGIEGVTEGGLAVERAAQGVLLADCLAAFTVWQPAVTAMCSRYRVPQRLVALLLRTQPPTAANGDPQNAAAETEAAQAADHTEPGTGAQPETSNAAAAAAVPTAVAPAGASSAAAADTQPDPDSEQGSDVYDEDWEDEAEGRSPGSQRLNSSTLRGNSNHEADGGVPAQGSANAAPQGSADAAPESAIEAQAAGTEVDAPSAGPASLSPEQRRRLQLQESLLRCLYSLAACGRGCEAQEAVQKVLREAGAPLLERLARVLQDRLCLGGCSAAAYLLWLIAAGEYSSNPSAEANALRDRMAAAAPAATAATAATVAPAATAATAAAAAPAGARPNAAGGGSSSSGGGHDVVSAVCELLLRHLSDWRDAEMEDCVPEVRTALSPPPSAQAEQGGPGAAGGPLFASSGNPDNTSPGQRQRILSRLSSCISRNDADAYRRGDAVVGAHAAGREDAQAPGPRGDALTGGGGTGGGAAYPDGSEGRGQMAAAGLSQLRVGSAGLLLTPQQSRPTSAQPPTPQRYVEASSDEEDGGRGGTRGLRGNALGHGVDDEYGGTDPFGGTAGTQDMDLSNIIDSSVELTGKEQIMRAIQDAAMAISLGDDNGKEALAPGGSNANVVQFPHAAAAGTLSASRIDDTPFNHAATAGVATASSAVMSPHQTSPGEAALGPPRPSGIGPHASTDTATQLPSHGDPASAGGDTAHALQPAMSIHRPPPLVLAPEPASPSAGYPVNGPPQSSLAARLTAVRHIRSRRPRPSTPPPEEVQTLLCNCVGLLAALALSASGAKAIAANPGLLSYVASLLSVPEDALERAASVPEAAASGSGLELRLQLLALLSNLTLRSDGASAVAAAAGAAGGPTLAAALVATALLSCRLVGSSPTSWRAGLQLLESCFTLLSNLQRAHAAVSAPIDKVGIVDGYSLAMEALTVPLPGPMGRADRLRLRAAAARMLDSAIAAYEGIGQTAPPAAVSELVALLELGGSAAVATAAVATAAGVSVEVADRAACDAAGALWQLMAAGQAHPDGLMAALQGPVSAILNRRDASPELSRRCLGLVSCLARSPLLCRRMWTTPLALGVLAAHACAKAAGEGEVERVATEVCQQLCRACHREDRGDVSDTDKRVDRWGLAEKMLAQLGCKLKYDEVEEAIVLVPLEE